MAKYIAVLLIFSVLLIFANSKPSKRKHRNSDVDYEEKIEETISEERNETLVTFLTKFNDFYADIMPELKLTLSKDCEDDKLNATEIKQELTPTASLDCLTLDAAACAANLKNQFNKKVKEEYIRELKSFITKIFEIYTAILKDLPKNDPHKRGLQTFLDLITTDLPKLNTSLELEYLDRMYRAMHSDLKPKFPDAKIDDESKGLYDRLVEKHSSEIPSMEEVNENKNKYINKVWKELIEDLHAVELFKRL